MKGHGGMVLWKEKPLLFYEMVMIQNFHSFHYYHYSSFILFSFSKKKKKKKKNIFSFLPSPSGTIFTGKVKEGKFFGPDMPQVSTFAPCFPIQMSLDDPW